MDEETKLTAWQETGAVPVTAGRSMPPSIGSTETSYATTRAEFAEHVGPCLALTAPTGMDQAERKTWLGAAHKALAKYPANIIARAAEHAMTRADHPSKIVPLMADEAERLWFFFRPREPRPQALPKPIETAEERAEREEVGKLMRGLVKKLPDTDPDLAA